MDLFRYHVSPVLLIVGTTVAAQLLAVWGGEVGTSWSLVGNPFSWAVVAITVFWSLISLWIPGRIYHGPATSFGLVPTYKANGVAFFVVSVLAYLLLVNINPDIANDITENFPQILASCNIFAFVFCVYLYVQGKYFPQSSEKKEEHPPLYEFYRGVELHPRILGVDVKQLTICRFGMLAWEVLVLNFLVSGWLTHGFNFPHVVCVILQTAYLFKFFWWETGYFHTIDIMHDRAGYYLCWGCIVWVPSMFTFASYFMGTYPPIVSGSAGCLILKLGVVSIILNYWVDWQKEYFRKMNGKCHIWRKPATYIKAVYKTSDGQRHSLLLTSGFWGVARHMNYLFELMIAFSWSLPGLGYGIWPFFYPVFLTVLIIHRIFRDEDKCSKKYGAAWNEYCKVVPHRMIPGVF